MDDTDDTDPAPRATSPTYDIEPETLVLLLVEASQYHGYLILCDSEATKEQGGPRFKVFRDGIAILLGGQADEVIDLLLDEVWDRGAA